ncbi:MAG: diguanylate cyclase [Deltaproteobacteria bacterium]|nr:diguanylate cyclase [Deltaproteobacteria bacterium]
MKLNRPKLSVSAKTFLALSMMFWIPVLSLIAILFYLFQNLVYDEASIAMKIHLKGAKNIYEERGRLLEGFLEEISSHDKLAGYFKNNNRKDLQRFLLSYGKKNEQISFFLAVDENQRVITRRNENRDDLVKIGNMLSTALNSGVVTRSTELVNKDFITREDESLGKLINNTGMVQFVASPVREENRVVGALVAGILLTADPWFGNAVYNRMGMETAIFAGEPPEGAFLHTTASLPRSTWVLGQAIPRGIKDDVSLGKPYYGLLDVSDKATIVAFEPIKDSKARLIGAIGVSAPAREYRNIVLGTLQKGTIVVAIMGLIIAIIVTIFIRADISRPLKFLTGAMNRFGKGELDITVDLVTGDEFEQLGTGFNLMAGGIKKREDRLRKHNEVAKLLMSTLNLKDLMENILRIAVQVTESQMGIIYLCEDNDKKLAPRVTYGIKSDINELLMGEGYPGRAAQDKTTLIVSPDRESYEEMIELGFTKSVPKEIAYIPLVYQERSLGTLVLGSVEKFAEDEVELFDYLANQISVALDNAIMHQHIHELSMIDGLTGLFNRRHLNERLEEEWATHTRHEKPLSVILSDIDNFKSVNDTYGHDKGDEVIRDIAAIFKDCCRTEDIPGRYGGEEFVAILPNTDSEGALKVAKRIAEKARSNHYDWMDKAATLSVGVASVPEIEAKNGEDLVQVADGAMYQAKTTGKDKVVTAKKGRK